jgi:DNA-binding protein H-NS
MAKIDLDALSIEELASLREHVTDKLFEKVAARRAELEAELEKLAQYGKPAKKPESAPVAKAKKSEDVREPQEAARDALKEAARQAKEPAAKETTAKAA